MGYRSGGMIFPFKGNSEEVVDLINSWTEKDFEILEPNLKFIRWLLTLSHPLVTT